MMPIDPALVERVTAAYRARFGCAPDHLVHAPGRVNLIGEHTDYNDGFVLPCAINHGTVIAIGASAMAEIEVIAVDYDGAVDRFTPSLPIRAREKSDWADHVRGVVSVMLGRGLALGGANIAIAGNVPQGAGLSSSASLSVALGRALQARNDCDGLTPVDLALIAQKSENDFVDTACGIMDQLVSAKAQARHALLIDCRSLDTCAIPMPDDLAILIVHSGVHRELSTSKYNERRAQCEAVADHFGVTALRDINMERLASKEAALDPVSFRRARHVVTENARTLAAAEALAARDLSALGGLMAASHASMRDDFEITVPPVDALVALLQSAIGDDGGARMTGGGFGGCVVALLPRDRVESVQQDVARGYRAPNGQIPMVLSVTAAGGVKRLSEETS